MSGGAVAKTFDDLLALTIGHLAQLYCRSLKCGKVRLG